MKLTMKDLENISPTGEEITLKFERDYNGAEEEIKVMVYPLTTEEKIEIQLLNDDLSPLAKKKERSDEEDKKLMSR